MNSYGYPFEIYHVETKDGYILELHRIPYSFRRNQSEEKKSVIFLKHGVADSSAAFLFAGPNVSLGSNTVFLTINTLLNKTFYK